MKKLVFLFLLVSSSPIIAQHCAYCGAMINVLKPVAEGDSVAISGLKITFLDSLGTPVMESVWRQGAWIEDTLRMWQNPPRTTFTGYIDNENPMQPRKMRFWFAEDNYILMGMRKEISTILIEDPRGRFESKEISVLGLDSYPLCSDFSSWDLPMEHRSFVKGYSPLLVELKKRDS